MCAPGVIQQVSQELSQHSFVSLACGEIAVSLGSSKDTALQSSAPEASKESKKTLMYSKVQDLTHSISPNFPVFPAFTPFQIRNIKSLEKDGLYANELTLVEHTGTHLDAPSHFTNGLNADQLAVESFIAPLAVISIESRAKQDSDTGLTVDDIILWEKKHGRLPLGAVVAMHTGWEARLAQPGKFANADNSGTLHFPGFSGNAAKFLVFERDIVGIAVDTLSLDIGAASVPTAHLTILGAGKYGLENVANLALVPPSGATVIIGAPKHQGASGGPSRVMALI
jgi:kynurenine formamidase